MDGQDISSIILGDGAFPMKSWLLKPYGNAIIFIYSRQCVLGSFEPCNQGT